MFLSLKTLYRKRTVIWPFYFYTIIRTLSNLHRLLSSYKQSDVDRRRAYRNFLSEYVNGSIEKTFDLMNTELLGEYDHAIRRHKVLIQTIKENK